MGSEDDATAVEGARARRTAPPPTRALERGATIDRYLVIDVLGEGGMGVIYRAYDPSLDRQVALKCVRPRDRRGTAIPHARERLFREAQALAQLSHPNVVAVHDVGVSGDDVYIAMELVEGDTLRRWLGVEKRSVDAIIEVFVAAGAGLAAAHRQGLVHRDFKPDNVILGVDGRVRVIDFGLARGPRDSSPIIDDSVPIPISGDSWSDDNSDTAISPMYAWAKALTHMGAVVGTPPYMAPEQHRGEPVDALTDQFSYGVALFKALYGQLPFKGKRDQLREAIASGKIEEPPGVRVSPRLRRIVRRALAPDRAERYPAMDQLLADLRRAAPKTHVRLAVAGIAGALLVSGTVLGAARLSRAPADDEPCAGANARLSGVWDANVRGRIEQAFAQTGYRFAVDSFERVARVLDGYTSSAITMQHDSCVATRVRGEQSNELLDLRTACLDRRWSELRALTHELAGAQSRQVVAGAIEAVSRLTPLAPCADVIGLRRAYPPPDAAQAKAVADVRALIDQSGALYRTGDVTKGTEVAKRAVALARTLKYPPALAEALYALGFNTRGVGAKEEGATWRELIKVAAQSRDEQMVAEGWTQLMMSIYESNPEEALRLREQAETAVALAGDDPILRSHLLTAVGLASSVLGRDKETRAAREAALAAVLQSKTAAIPEDIAGAEINLGRTLDGQGDSKGGRAHIEKGVALLNKALGPNHPDVALAKFNLADTLMNHDEYEAAEKLLVEAGESWEATLGPDHRNMAFIHADLALIASYRGEHAIAKQKAERAVKISEQVFGRDHISTADVLAVYGRVLGPAKDYKAANEIFRRVLSIAAKQGDTTSGSVAWVYDDMADLAFAQKKWAEARAHRDRARRGLETSAGPDSPPVGMALIGLADCDVELKRPALALEEAERGLELMMKADPGTLSQAHARFVLARARWAAKSDRPGAVELAKQALEGYRALGKLFAEDRQEVEDWLKSR